MTSLRMSAWEATWNKALIEFWKRINLKYLPAILTGFGFRYCLKRTNNTTSSFWPIMKTDCITWWEVFQCWLPQRFRKVTYGFLSTQPLALHNAFNIGSN